MEAKNRGPKVQKSQSPIPNPNHIASDSSENKIEVAHTTTTSTHRVDWKL